MFDIANSQLSLLTQHFEPGPEHTMKQNMNISSFVYLVVFGFILVKTDSWYYVNNFM